MAGVAHAFQDSLRESRENDKYAARCLASLTVHHTCNRRYMNKKGRNSDFVLLKLELWYQKTRVGEIM